MPGLFNVRILMLGLSIRKMFVSLSLIDNSLMDISNFQLLVCVGIVAKIVPLTVANSKIKM